jgi:hypothetical protein
MDFEQVIAHRRLQKYYEIACCAIVAFHFTKIQATESHGACRGPQIIVEFALWFSMESCISLKNTGHGDYREPQSIVEFALRPSKIMLRPVGLLNFNIDRKFI